MEVHIADFSSALAASKEGSFLTKKGKRLCKEGFMSLVEKGKEVMGRAGCETYHQLHHYTPVAFFQKKSGPLMSNAFLTWI